MRIVISVQKEKKKRMDKLIKIITYKRCKKAPENYFLSANNFTSTCIRIKIETLEYFTPLYFALKNDKYLNIYTRATGWCQYL